MIALCLSLWLHAHVALAAPTAPVPTPAAPTPAAPAIAPHAACAVPMDHFAAKIAAAEQAYATFEVGTFSSSMDEAALILPCLATTVPTGVAAHYLRMLGLQYFTEHDTVKADAVFGAARSLDSIYQFPDTLIPVGHPVRAHYAALDLASVQGAPIGAPRTGSVIFNGSASTQRPGWPAIVQVVDANMRVTATALVFPTDALPAYDAMPLSVTQQAATGTTVRKPLNPKVPLAIVAGAAVVGSVSLYARAVADAADFRTYRADDTIDDLVARQQKANNMVYGSAAVGLVAVGCGVGAIFVGKW